MKVLFISHTGALSSGGEISNYHLMQYLKANGHEVYFIFPDWNNKAYQQALEKEGIEFYTQPYTWWGNGELGINKPSPQNIRLVGEIYKIIKKFNPDIVVTNTTVIPWGAFAAALTNKPHVWVSREFAIGEFAYLGAKMDFVGKYSNIIMANSKQLASFISKNYGLPVKHFYSFVDESKLKTGSKTDEVRIVSPNQITKRKNQIELVEAIAILKKRNKSFNTKTILIGDRDQEYWQEINAVIEQNNLENIIKTHDFTDAPWQLVGKNDILVQSSLSESIGRTTIEAMKLGIPVIASDIPGHKEAFELGGGTLYKSRNPHDLANKIEQALGNFEKSKQNAQKIKQKVLETMSEEACNKPFLEVLEQVKGQANPEKELQHVAHDLNDYIQDREGIIRSQEHILRENDKDLARQSDLINKQVRHINDLINSRSYRMGRFQIRIIKKTLIPLKLLKAWMLR